LLKQSYTPEAVRKTVDETMHQVQFVREMYALGLSEVEVRAEIDKYQPQIIAFAQKHCGSKTAAAPWYVSVNSCFKSCYSWSTLSY
jgi:DNA replication factor Dna2